MTVRQAKRLMRREVVGRILAACTESRKLQDAGLLAKFGGLRGFAEARTILLYASAFPEEIDTRPLVRFAFESGKRVILPRVNEEFRRLDLLEVKNDAGGGLVAGRLGIMEPPPDAVVVDPRAIDWVMVPGLAFDEFGARLGRGGGYYDRLLPTLRYGCTRWALIYDEQWVDRVPVEPHDARMDGLASATRTATC